MAVFEDGRGGGEGQGEPSVRVERDARGEGGDVLDLEEEGESSISGRGGRGVERRMRERTRPVNILEKREEG